MNCEIGKAKSNYKKIGEHIQLVDERNKGLQVKQLLGLSISKQFIPSVANIIGADMENYKIIRKNQFACSTMQVRRDKKMPVALLQEVDEAIISQAYPVFEVKDSKELLPEYLMMWFTRSEFDREACFNAVGGVRGSLEWEDFENMQLPIPSPEKQREIVAEYNVIQNRINLNNQLIAKLEETAQTVYREWFVEGIDLENLPEGWSVGTLGEVMDTKGYIRGPFGSALKVSDMQSKGIPVYEQQHAIDNHRNFRYFISEEKHDSLKRFTVKENDFVVSCSGTIGRLTEIDKGDKKGIINQALLILRVNKAVLHPKIFKYFITSPEGNSLLIQDAGGSAQVNIAKKEQLVSIPLIIPDCKTQETTSKKLIAIDDIIKQKTKENQKLTELKELLLSRLATMSEP
jgi:type I restriction enzyme, S subunit